MGKDKFENEELIKFGFPEDIWFHVDDFSSAHVYLRLQEDETFDQIPKQALDECCQLVKQNSIEGCKREAVNIVYTPCSNLLKKQYMEIGEVGFTDKNLVFLVLLRLNT